MAAMVTDKLSPKKDFRKKYKHKNLFFRELISIKTIL